jgi:hypothetical protein
MSIMRKVAGETIGRASMASKSGLGSKSRGKY